MATGAVGYAQPSGAAGGSGAAQPSGVAGSTGSSSSAKPSSAYTGAASRNIAGATGLLAVAAAFFALV